MAMVKHSVRYTKWAVIHLTNLNNWTTTYDLQLVCMTLGQKSCCISLLHEFCIRQVNLLKNWKVRFFVFVFVFNKIKGALNLEPVNCLNMTGHVSIIPWPMKLIQFWGFIWPMTSWSLSALHLMFTTTLEMIVFRRKDHHHHHHHHHHHRYNVDPANVQGQIRLNGNVSVTQLDIRASNGYIQHVDGLLTPESLLPLLPRRCDVTATRTVRVGIIHCDCISVQDSLSSHWTV